jgi:hypothetical protein
MAWSSSNNAVLVNDCESLQNLTVTLQVTASLITAGNNGFSLQLNCYPQKNSSHLGVPLYWAQYVIAVDSDSVQGGIQYWSYPKGSGFSPKHNYVPFAQLAGGGGPPNSVPQGSVMKIAIATNPKKGNVVTSATFSITFPGAPTRSHKFTFPSTALCAISGFQVDLVGPPVGTHTCKFTSGAGTLIYSVSSGTLAVAAKTPACYNPDLPNNTNIQQTLTGETSNAAYGAVTPASGPTVSQSLSH